MKIIFTDVSSRFREKSLSKVWLTMKLSALFLFVTCLQVSANVNAQRVTLNEKNASLESVFQSIHKQTGYEFLYNTILVDKAVKTNLELNNRSLTKALDCLFENRTLTYQIVGKTIIVREKERPLERMIDQRKEILDRPIDGVVVDSITQEPLVGVTIKVKGTTIGTVTDGSGSFQLNVPDDAVLEVSFVGFSTKEVAVGNLNRVDINLSSSATALDQLIVVGYGTQKKMDATGAITQIEPSNAESQPVTTTSKFLQGKMPGMNVLVGTGKPGTSGDLNIRGNTSISSSGEPLVLIDGIPGSMDDVSPANIESVTILKDASSAAIYGSRAAFGVILITTKGGAAGKPTVSFSTNLTLQTPQVKTDFITSAFDYFKIADTAYSRALGPTLERFTAEDLEEIEKRRFDKVENPERPWVVVGKDSKGDDIYKYYGNFDWYHYYNNKWRPKQDYNITFSGGNDDITYYLAGNLTQEKGTYRTNPDHYNEKGMRAKFDFRVTPWFKLSSNTRFLTTRYTYNGVGAADFPSAAEALGNQFYFTYPNNVPKNPDGTNTFKTENGIYDVGHGVPAALGNPDFGGNEVRKHFNTTFEGVADITKELKLTGNFSYIFDPQESYEREVPLTYSLYPGVEETMNSFNENKLTQIRNKSDQYVFNLFASYVNSFGKHNIDGVIGYNQQLYKSQRITGIAHDMIGTSLNDFNLSIGRTELSGGQTEWALRSLFYRANYNFNEKYYLQVAGRYDGTSRFPSGDRFGFFPTVSAGWTLSNEEFFHSLTSVLNFFKLRGSYGTLGNQVVNAYSYISGMSVSNMSYLNSSYDQLQSTSVPRPVSPSLTWEKVTSKNLGFDAAFFNNKLNLTFDGYIRDTKGMLTKGKTLPGVFGANEPEENAADLRTKGYEIEIKWKDNIELNNGTLSYYISGYLTDYVAHITKFDNPQEIISDFYEGQRLGDIWGYHYDGFFKTDKEAQEYDVDMDRIQTRRVSTQNSATRKLQAGDIKILDLDGDKVITEGAGTVSDPGDRTIIGNSQPRYQFGLQLGASYKRFSLDISFDGIGSQGFYPGFENIMFWSVYSRPYPTYIPTDFKEKMWSPDNPDAYFPRVFGYAAHDAELSKPNDMYLQNLGYLKLRDLTLGYQLPESILKKLKLQQFQVSLNAYNLLTWAPGFKTKYEDPEENMINDTGKTYPMPKSFSIGFKITY